MKKFLVLAFVAVIAFACSPKIVVDSVHKGEHTVVTGESNLYSFQHSSMSCSLGIRVSQKDTILALLITYDGDTGRGIFDKEDQLIFTLNDGSKFALRNLYDNEYESSSEVRTTTSVRNDYTYAYAYSPIMDDIYVTPVSVTRFVPQVYTVKNTKSYGLYLLTKKQFSGIVTSGVKELVIEAIIGDSKMPKPENFAPMLWHQFELIQARMPGLC